MPEPDLPLALATTVAVALPFALTAAAAVAVAYVLGTLPAAHLAARRHGVDPTAVGSGNPGTTNVLRNVGRTAGLLTLAGDLGKGAAAAGLGWAVDGRTLAVACGAAAVVGHVAPVTRGFRGGKGVATGVGMALATFPLAAAVGIALFAGTWAVLRRSSVLQEAGIVAMPVVAGLTGADVAQLLGVALVAALIVVRLHVPATVVPRS
ncbi:MAG TPA: glycerol-3-phosphate acyltransferase [Acidimicrobiales bacterium]